MPMPPKAHPGLPACRVLSGPGYRGAFQFGARHRKPYALAMDGAGNTPVSGESPPELFCAPDNASPEPCLWPAVHSGGSFGPATGP